jgi:hypothetical protein
MVAMPYYLVNIVLDIFSLVLFCMTSVALLFRSLVASWLPPRLRRRKTLTLIVTQGLVLSALAMVAMRVVSRLKYVYIFSLPLFEVLFFIGALNCMVLAYQFLDKRCFLSMPKIPRRLLIALCSAVVTGVPLLAVVTAVVGLFIIK